MAFIQVFKRTNRVSYFVDTKSADLAEAAAHGLACVAECPEAWGEFLYARPVAKTLLFYDALYRLEMTDVGIWYFPSQEAVAGPADYIDFSGPAGEDLKVELNISHPKGMSEGSLTLTLPRAKEFLIGCLNRSNLFRFTMRGGITFAQFFDEKDMSVTAELPLTVIR